MPWARHDSDYTYDFETAVTWLTLHTAIIDASEFFRIDWHTAGSVVKRVQKDLEQKEGNRFDNLVEIGIDETSYKKKAQEYGLQHAFHCDGWFIIHCIKNLISSGKLELPTEEQRKSLTAVAITAE